MAVRTIKLRLVLENAQAIRAAQQFGNQVKTSTAAGVQGFSLMSSAMGGMRQVLAGIVGYQGIRLLLQQFKTMIQSVYKADAAMATAWENHQRRAEKAGKTLATPAIQQSRNIWGGYSSQAIAKWYSDRSIQAGLPGGLQAAASAGFSPLTQIPVTRTMSPEQRASAIQMRGQVMQDFLKTRGARGADPTSAGVAWQQMFEVGGLKTRPQWRQGLAQWAVGSELSQYNPSQQTTALERTLPQLMAMGMNYGDIQAATAAFSPYFPKRPKMASRTLEMMAHHVGFRGGRGSGILHRILRKRGIDPSATRKKGDWAMRWMGAINDWILEGDPQNPDPSFEGRDARMQEISSAGGMPVRIERTTFKSAIAGGWVKRYGRYKTDIRAATFQNDIEEPFLKYMESVSAQQRVAENVKEKGALFQSRGPGTPEEAEHIQSRQAKLMQGGTLQLAATAAFTEWRKQHRGHIGTPAEEEGWKKIQYVKGQAVVVQAALLRVSRIARIRLRDIGSTPSAGTKDKNAEQFLLLAQHHYTRIQIAGERAESVPLHPWSASAEQRLDAYSNAVRDAIVFLRRIELGLPMQKHDKFGAPDVTDQDWAASMRGPEGAAALRDWKDPFTWGAIPGALPSGNFGTPNTDVIPAPQQIPTTQPSPANGQSSININTYYAGPVRNLAQAPGLFNPDIAV